MKKLDLPQGSQEWHTWRQNGIGASDVSAIVGSNPYKTTLQLWEEKCGFRSNSTQTNAMQFGIKNEEKARNWVNKNLNYSFSPLCCEDSEENSLHASLDGWDEEKETVLEIKCPVSEKILDSVLQTGEVPQHWLDQVQWQLIVSKAREAILGVWDWREEKCKIIKIDPEVEKQYFLIKEAKEFWNKVISGIAPEPGERDYIEVEDENLRLILEEYKDADKEEKKQKSVKKLLKEQIVEFGDDGNFTAYGVKVKRCVPRACYDIEAMRAAGIDVEKFKIQKNSIGFYKIILPRS